MSANHYFVRITGGGDEDWLDTSTMITHREKSPSYIALNWYESHRMSRQYGPEILEHKGEEHYDEDFKS